MMSSRPFAPQEYVPIQVPENRPHRRGPGAASMRMIVIPITFFMAVFGTLIWWPDRRAPHRPNEAEVALMSPPVAAQAARREPAGPPPAFSEQPGSERVLSGISLGFNQNLESQIEGVAGIFETNLPLHIHNAVDDEVFRNLGEKGIKSAKLCSDEAFVRRVYLDVIGTLPTAHEAREFLDSHDPGKRTKLIDELLERPEFADYWAMKWCDTLRVKAEFPINLWPNAAQAYHRWIHDAIADNVPYDRFAFELLTASGSNFRKPQVNFYRALQSKEPEAIAEIVALTFLCERTEHWSERRRQGLAQFFCKVGYKPTGEWKEEIIFYDPRRDGSGPPNEPVQAMYPSGATITIPAGQDPRVVFANWLIHDKNPWFARAMANRVWYWLVGRGIVDPPDDVRSDNPPSNLPLLNRLAAELIAAEYDLKHLIRLILDSNAYQLSCIPAGDDATAAQHFAYYRPRRLDAEVLIDAICQITGTSETYMSIIPEPFTFLPSHQRAIALPDGSITSSFLEMFGRPARDTGLASERNHRLTASQALHLLNSNHLRNKLKNGPGIKRLVEQAYDSWDTASLLYLTILSRRPTEAELQIAGQLCDYDSGTRELAWALINSDEFLFRH